MADRSLEERIYAERRRRRWFLVVAAVAAVLLHGVLGYAGNQLRSSRRRDRPQIAR